MIRSLAMKFHDDYIVFWKVEPVELVEDQYHLQITSRMRENDKWQESTKNMFLSKEQLDMIFSFFNGVHNDLNK